MDTFLIVVDTSKTSTVCTVHCNYLIVTESTTRTEAGQESNEANLSAETTVSHSELKIIFCAFHSSSTLVHIFYKLPHFRVVQYCYEFGNEAQL